jgi:putative lipoic acid-binding regulatory protein
VQPIGGSPIIEYPTDWSYTLLGWDEAEIRAAVGEIIPTTEHTLCFSHRSKRGTYCSLELVIEVVTEEERLDLYTRLGEHEAIRMVL